MSGPKRDLRLPCMSRGHVFPEIGKRTEPLKTSVSDKMKARAEVEAERMGYPDVGAWLFDVVIQALYGEEYLRSLYKAQLDRAEKLATIAGPVSKKALSSGGSR